MTTSTRTHAREYLSWIKYLGKSENLERTKMSHKVLPSYIFFMAFHWIFSWQTVFAGIKTQLLWMIAFELLPLADEVVGSNFFSHVCYSVRWESHMTITHDVLDLTNRDPTPWTCSNLFSLDLTAVQSSHPSDTGPGFALPPYGWWAGHWHPTRMFSCWSILWDRSFCWIRWIGLGINLYIIRTPFL